MAETPIKSVRGEFEENEHTNAIMLTGLALRRSASLLDRIEAVFYKKTEEELREYLDINMAETMTYWDCARNYAPSYRQQITHAQNVVEAAALLLTKSEDPNGLMRSLVSNFPLEGHHGSIRHEQETLIALTLVRRYSKLSPDKQTELLSLIGWDSHDVFNDESNQVKTELGALYYSEGAEHITQAILEGKLQLPSQEQLAPILALRGEH